ncbi:chemotaxis protein CheW [Paraburkholderia phymatum]|uniref:Chemotaxis protein CheW n=1 Tax=Paraburkholderia phymatum (strain DSM 17167 / CIP 108236 / LMG 21445 / STM815) TaxID=391038 RepID=B2JNG8_PARP8|nr:chemotaxis protein CheW [Paraburkholderia phymatum]ACC74470.1 CheW protein [Paraburkholderia phymatum STM815]
MLHDAPDVASATVRIDDCWNRIGTRGDNTCPRLADYSRCLNCPVFAQRAARLLDRPLSDADVAPRRHAGEVSGVAPAEDTATDSALAFRIAGEWLALPTRVLREVDAIRAIHSLPHQRSRAVLGIVNVRGALTLAVSLGELLNMEPAAHAQAVARNGHARMLVAAHDSEPPVAFPVDEVEGVIRYADATLLPVPATLAHATASHARGVQVWRDQAIGVLDPARLFDSIARSLR